ncbi:MAG TPA: Lon-like protease helical domain-containing protein [Gemmataceae bacterium]|nr:Lon-like protease helical domain-containing protein [Gemmataceae bacterium]
MEFGLAVRHRGYNIYVSGMTGTGKKQLIQKLLEARAGREKTPDDWVYVHNFDEPDRPLVMRLPTGHGVRLRAALEEVIDRLRHDVIDAVREGKFQVWAVDTIDEGIELLTGMPAGDVDQEGTFHHLLDQRLQEILSLLQAEPASEATPRVHLAPAAARMPSLPPLPGDRGDGRDRG